MKHWFALIAVSIALLGYAAFTGTFEPTRVAKVDNPYWLTQWELDHITNPEVQQRLEIIKARQKPSVSIDSTKLK